MNIDSHIPEEPISELLLQNVFYHVDSRLNISSSSPLFSIDVEMPKQIPDQWISQKNMIHSALLQFHECSIHSFTRKMQKFHQILAHDLIPRQIIKRMSYSLSAAPIARIIVERN